MSTLSASDAFYKQLKKLRIEDFPCGFGSWVCCHVDVKCDSLLTLILICIHITHNMLRTLIQDCINEQFKRV